MARMNFRRKISIVLSGCLLATGLFGCGVASRDNTEADSVQVEQDYSVQETDNKLHDRDTLYERDDDTSVVTMYLTVSTGNKSDNTDHTWTQVNSYSAYDYEAMGVDRFAVNGLLQVGNESGPVEGEFGYGQVAPNATVTIRGQTSTKYTQKNYRIAIRDDKGTWNNQKVINLNKHQQDPTRFANKMCYDLMKNLDDMISLRTQFVHLYVKDTTAGGNNTFVDYGLYTQVEQFNKRALQSHGLDKNGQLYKINFFEFYRYEDAIKTKNDASYDVAEFEKHLEIKGNDDHSKLIAMLDDVNDYSIPIEEVVDNWFERDNLFSWWAFHILMGNTDTQSRNTFLYSPLNSNTFYFVSWDNDGSFTSTTREYISPGEEAGWQKGVTNYCSNVLFNRILKSKELRTELDSKVKEYKEYLSKETLNQYAQEYASVIKQYAFQGADMNDMPVTAEEYEQLLSKIPNETDINYKQYEDSLKEPMPFYIGEPQKVDGGLKFTWDNSYDWDEQTITYTIELATDYEFTNTIFKQDNLFVPEFVYKNALAPGQYFVRIKAINESGKEQYAFNYYVTADSIKKYGITCFFVLPDGTIAEDVYDDL